VGVSLNFFVAVGPKLEVQLAESGWVWVTRVPVELARAAGRLIILCCVSYSCPVPKRHLTVLATLEERRNRQDLIEVSKMSNGSSRLKLNEFFTLADNTRRIRGHSRKLVKFWCTRDGCKYFFE